MQKLLLGVLVFASLASCSNEPAGDRDQTESVVADVQRIVEPFFEINRAFEGDAGCGDGSGRVSLQWFYDSEPTDPSLAVYEEAVIALAKFVEEQNGSVQPMSTDGDGFTELFAEIGSTSVSMVKGGNSALLGFSGGCVGRGRP